MQFENFGGPEVLQLRDVPDPVPGRGDVLIRTRVAGVNFGELIIREGGAPVPVLLPLIPGSEAAGIVEEVGEDVVGLAVGSRVAVPLFAAGRLDGGYAELISAPASVVVALPGEVDFETAVGLQMQGLTALAMVNRTEPEGKTVLVHAAAGGVGSNLLQLARIRGARVIATAGSAEKLDVALRLGADVAVDYRQPGWDERVLAATDGRGVDIVYDPVGGELRDRSLGVLADEGTLVGYGIAGTGRFEPIDGAALAQMYVKSQALLAFSLWPAIRNGADLRSGLEELFDLSTTGRLTTLIGGTYPLAEGALAHAAVARREHIGKIVLIP